MILLEFSSKDHGSAFVLRSCNQFVVLLVQTNYSSTLQSQLELDSECLVVHKLVL